MSNPKENERADENQGEEQDKGLLHRLKDLIGSRRDGRSGAQLERDEESPRAPAQPTKNIYPLW